MCLLMLRKACSRAHLQEVMDLPAEASCAPEVEWAEIRKEGLVELQQHAHDIAISKALELWNVLAAERGHEEPWQCWQINRPLLSLFARCWPGVTACLPERRQ